MCTVVCEEVYVRTSNVCVKVGEQEGMCYMCSFIRISYWVKVVAGCDETYWSLEHVTVEIHYNWAVNSGNYHHGVELWWYN